MTSEQTRVDDGPATSATRKGDQTRTLILRTALTQFGEQGYRGASLRDIASRCGISHPGLLYHFPTKEALLLAVLDHRDQVDRAEHATANDSGIDVLRRLVRSAQVNQSRPGIVELFVVVSAESTSVEHPAHQFFQDRYARLVDEVARAYAEVEEQGGLVAGVQPRRAAQQVIALMDGLQVQWLLDNDGVDMSEALRTHIQRDVSFTV
ncbi:TetR/AcrR family transcriptional regulator [Demequina aurantiaca]|uniref:TetR/AcrR family transcriptional regulator n=1 Tax=Demequina aurantiaca TaxID=676200 RepID=UPI0007837352|nr:TetR/AcrR family transcriptional regulator [Demequina aurantiaca]